METLRFELGESAKDRAVVQASELYGPQEAVREYVTNGIDTVKDARARGYAGVSGVVTVGVSIPGRSISVQDDGMGMNEATVRSLTGRIWDSAKRGGYVQSGEKGIGLLAFGSIGDSVSIISRDGPGAYNHLRFEKEERGEKSITPGFERLSEEDMARFYGGGFERGTKVIMGVSPDHLRKKLAPRALESFLRATYAPLLHRTDVRVWLDEDGKAPKMLEAPTYKGDILVATTVPFVAGTKSNPVDGVARVYLVFDPECDKGAIALHERDVRVWESIAAQEEELKGMKLWTSPQLRGFVNTTGLVLTQDRDDVVRENRGYHNLLEKIAELERGFGPLIEARAVSVREGTEKRVVQQAYELLSRAYALSGSPLNKAARLPSSAGNTHSGAVASKTHLNGSSTAPKKKPRTCPQVPIQVKSFDTDKDHLRVCLDQMLGDPVIIVNAAHPAYREAATAGNGTHTHYVMGCIAYGLASVEMQEALEKRETFSHNTPIEIAAEINSRAQSIIDATRRGGRQ